MLGKGEINMKRANLFLVLICLMISGCASVSKDWQKTLQTNTVEAYTQFLSEYPSSEYAPEAQSRIEDLSYSEASRTNTVEAFERFLDRFPQGSHSQEARDKLNALKAQRAEKQRQVQEQMAKEQARKEARRAQDEPALRLVSAGQYDTNSVKQLQLVLKAAGYYSGAEDGIVTGSLRRAMIDWHEAFRSQSGSNVKEWNLRPAGFYQIWYGQSLPANRDKNRVYWLEMDNSLNVHLKETIECEPGERAFIAGTFVPSGAVFVNFKNQIGGDVYIIH
jgi:hypothetical protein